MPDCHYVDSVEVPPVPAFDTIEIVPPAVVPAFELIASSIDAPSIVRGSPLLVPFIHQDINPEVQMEQLPVVEQPFPNDQLKSNAFESPLLFDFAVNTKAVDDEDSMVSKV